MAQLILLTVLTMVAFAANSLFNRAALLDGETGPAAFAALRLASGAFCLAGLVLLRKSASRETSRANRWIGAASLSVYMLGFSFAYVALDAGLGALILFGVVQVTMFAGGLAGGERPAPGRWIGTAVAMLGLAWLALPGGAGDDLPIGPTLLMVAAAIGWGVYSLAGKKAADPLRETATNFLYALPVAILVWIIFPDGLSASGAILAIISGAVTSGLGYALWYSVLPRLDASVAALSQLTVPVIAVIAGVIFLAEAPGLRTILASGMIVGGVALGILSQRKIGSSTS